MGATKTNLFTKEQNRIAELAKALAHPARIAILQYLLKTEGCICGDIVDKVPLSQSTVSQHLKELKKANIIKGTISGKSTCYCIDKVTWKENKIIFNTFFNQHISCC